MRRSNGFQRVISCGLGIGVGLLQFHVAFAEAGDRSLRHAIPQWHDTAVYKRDTSPLPTSYRLLRNQTDVPPRNQRPSPEARDGHGLQDRAFENRPILGPLPPPAELSPESNGGAQNPMGDPGSDPSAQCQLSAILNLSADALVLYIQTHDYSCEKFIWDYNAKLTTVYTTEKNLCLVEADSKIGNRI